jgi:hypothetical protein
MNLNYDKTYRQKIYIIGGVSDGGSLKFILDLKLAFPNFTHLIFYKDIKNKLFTPRDIILVQHLVQDIKPENIYNIKQKFDCRIIINIHDFCYLNNKSAEKNVHNLYLLNDCFIDKNVKRMFDISELIIHPSQFTYNIYSKYFDPSNFILSPHIDYKVLDSNISVPNIENKAIIIGVFSAYSVYKGRELIEYLMKNIKAYNGYNIIFKVVGLNIPKYKDWDFFEYLDTHKIQGLLLLNVWGETYCYALSKFLKSGLPFIYNNLGAFKERVPDLPQFFKVFDDENDINVNEPILKTKFFDLLDFILINHGSHKKTPLDTVINIPKLYRNLFNIEKYSSLDVRNVIILSSAIKTSRTPLSYTKTRSYFTEEERFQQTIKNIEILRYKIPYCAIILVDSTDMKQDYKNHLVKITDKYIDLSNDKDYYDAANVFLNKGISECMQVLKGLEYTDSYINIENIFKLTGRYYLSKSFKIEHFMTDKVQFKTIPKGSVFFEKVPACYTFLYKAPYKYKLNLISALENTIIKCKQKDVSIETILPYEFDKDLVDYDAILGVSGRIGPNNYLLEDIT